MKKCTCFLLFVIGIVLTSSASFAQGYPDFTQLVEDFAPSVVNISTERKRQSQEEMFRGSPFWPFFQTPPGGAEQYRPKPRSEGSGFIISKDGYILTNHHVIQSATKITVVLDDKTEYTAKVIGEDPATDVALLKIKAKGLKAVKVGNSGKVKVGEWVLAFGAPFGFDKTVTAGIISAKARSLPRDQFVNFLQSDVAINPGNSGGPLVNLRGEVVGINSQIYTRTGAYAGVSFSIPIELAMDVTEQLKESGRVKRGYLGVGYQEVTAEEAKSVGLKRPMGALVNNVEPDSPADDGGLKVGDIILKLNGYEIKRHVELPFVVGRIQPGTKVTVRYFRDGKTRTAKIKLAERSDTTVATRSNTRGSASVLDAIGIRVETMTRSQKRRLDVDGGVLVTRVVEGVAGDVGIRKGDVILSVNRKSVDSVDDFIDVIADYKAGDAVSLLIASTAAGGRRFVSFTIPEAE